MNIFTRLVCLWVALLPLCVPTFGQARAATSPSTDSGDSLPIGVGDLVQVNVLDEGDLQQTVRVNDRGEVVVNLLGKVNVAGLTPFEMGAVLRKGYIDRGYLTDPQVFVLVQQSFHQSVSVLGEVGHPGAVELTAPRSLLDVIALAGGFNPIADRTVTIRRKNNPSASETVFLPNDSSQTVAGGAVMIYPGDAVVVPKAGIVYVLGNVAHPGGFAIQYDSRITLLQAVALAGGPAPTAAEGRVRLLRHTTAGYSEKTLSLVAYEKGKLPDMELQRDDVIWIPFSYGKNVAIGAGSILASTGSALITTQP